MDKKFILALSSLIGTVIGAGIFGIPYVTAKSGILFLVFYFLTLGLIVLFVHLAFGEIILRTRQKHRLVGYAEKYFGQKAKILIIFSTLLGTIGSILVYIILSGDFLKLIFPSSLSSFQLSLIAWLFLSVFIIIGINSIAWFELLINFAFVVVIFFIAFFCLPEVSSKNFILFNSHYFLLPFGVVLFSLVGWNAVPEIERLLSKKKDLKKIIIFAIAIAIFVYISFGLLVSGVSGPATTQEAFQGLVPALGKKILMLAGIFGLLSVASSFLISANYLKNTLFFDCHISYFLSSTVTIFTPIIFFLLNVGNFISIMSFIGVTVGLIEGTMISFLWQKSKKAGNRQPEYSLKPSKILPYLVMFTLFIGALAQFIWP